MIDKGHIVDTLLDYTTEHLRQNSETHPDVQERIIRYSNVSPGCGHSLLYNPKEHVLKKSHCNCFSCSQCRPRLQRQLLNSIVSLAEKHHLTRQLIITVPGVEFRSKVSPDESFAYASKKFNDFRTLYKRRFGHNLEYIALMRSQDSGYCHYHILVGAYIPKKWLDQTMNSLKLGFPYIDYVDVHRLGAYLSKYWYKEHEWFIPKNKRHYSHSAGLTIDKFASPDPWYFMRFSSRSDVYSRSSLDRVAGWVERLSGYPPPFEYLVSVFNTLGENPRYQKPNYKLRGLLSPPSDVRFYSPMHRRQDTLDNDFIRVRPNPRARYTKQKKFRQGIFKDYKAKKK
jgi:hypothetical protein